MHTLIKHRVNSSPWRVLSRCVAVLSWLACVGVCVMIVITCADIILRKCGVSLTGAYDFVRIAGGITLAAALPMTTAAKGHVAIEFFFNRLPRHTRAAVNALMRIVQILLFSFAAFAFVRYGNRLLLSHEVLPTSRIPYFWLAWLLALSCAITSLVTVYHLFNNGKALFK